MKPGGATLLQNVEASEPLDFGADGARCTLWRTAGRAQSRIYLQMSGKNATLPPLSTKDLERLRDRAGEAAALLKALSNESRLLILCTLAGNEMSVSELNEQIPLSQSALSQQLAVLRREGLVETRREAQVIYYSVAPSSALRVIEVLRELYCRRPRRSRRPRAGRPSGAP